MARDFISENVKTLERYSYKTSRGNIAQRTEESVPRNNQLQVKATTITTSPTRIIMPDESGFFIIKHVTASKTVWIGGTDDIVAATGDVFPLEQYDEFAAVMNSGEENEIYGIVAADTAVIYVIGVTRA